MSTTRLVCASANPGKVAEMRALLDGVVDLVERPAEVADVAEDADTLVGNARLKARALVDATGLGAVADDTGLEVDALGGAPGVRTARFAGEGCSDADNRRRMLSELDGVDDRTARFRTVVLVRWPDGSEVVCEGVCAGRIATSERGDGGFGYDSIFVPDEGDGSTFAEMGSGAKNAISHRGRAMGSLVARLSSATGSG
ncbi:RdgB/HAM1 family non-canonical purine NTP pyrophosphatase [Ilumatobacter sp.]|uniref:RdgB/HAM1 family non-canonical purine NTP pyrophosphatase n=1 Tax=Ilumatobacter sp. TaxID=1967498 RepID=UPI003B52F37C